MHVGLINKLYHFQQMFSVFVSIFDLFCSSRACWVRHLRSISLYSYAFSINSLKNSLYSGSIVVNFGISKYVNCLGFLANTSSNGDNPCRAIDAKVFIAYALIAAYSSYVEPFPDRCLLIILPIVCICLLNFHDSTDLLFALYIQDFLIL